MSEEDIIGEIEALLKKVDLKESDFEKKEKVPGVKAPAHDKIVEEIDNYWSAKSPYLSRFSAYGIDFIGRKSSEGSILLAVEVDSGYWRAVESCLKLADIRCPNKVWIYITNEQRQYAKENFEYTLKEIRKLLRIRNENKSEFGNFAAFLKTPRDFRKEVIF